MGCDTNNNLKISEDILIEIFIRSSVKSLNHVKCVCKQWYALIRHNGFILKHLQYQKRNNKGRLLLQYFKDETQLYRYALFNDETLLNDSYHVFDHFQLHHWAIHMEGPINGLYCLFNRQDRNILWNPALMEMKIVPLPQTHFFPQDKLFEGLVGFGVDPSNHDYKLILVRSLLDSNDLYATVYNLTTNNWSILNIDDSHVLKCESLFESNNSSFLSGIYYWWTRSGIVIAFDIGEETFRRISGPELGHPESSLSGSLTVYNENIALLRLKECTIDIWVMLEEDVWIKKFSITSLPNFFWDVGLWKNDELLVAMDGYETSSINPNFQLVLCNPNTQEMRNVGPKGMPISFKSSIYYESLVSVNCRTEHKAKCASLKTISDYLLDNKTSTGS